MTNTDLSTKTAMVIDYGSQIAVAQRLSREFGEVLYYCPFETSYPKYNNYIIGRGVEGIEKIQNPWPYLDKVDIVIFPDLFMGAFQRWLRDEYQDKTINGKKILVYGAGMGEDMELYRDQMKKHQEEIGLPVNDYEVITGLTALREYLKTNDNVYVKTNLLRGMMESWHHENYDLSKPVLDELTHTLGIYQEEETFIVEQPVENAVEVGYDGWAIDGRYPRMSLCGIEVKDAGYVGKFINYSELPKGLKRVTDKLAPTFQSYNYRGAYSNEVRITEDGKGYLIDQTCRQPEPNTSLALEAYDNYGQIVWQVANGEVPNISCKKRYGVQLIIKSEWAKTEPQPIYFPKEIERFVKIKNLVVQNGVHYFVPQVGIEMEEIGSVVATGNSLDEAIKTVTGFAKQIKGFAITINYQALDKAQEEIKKLKSFGINFI